MNRDPYDQYPQNRPMPHPGAPKWQDYASQEFLETTEGSKEYWQKQALMWKKNFGELFQELQDKDHELQARREILDSAVALKERLLPDEIGNGWIDSIRFLGEEIERLRAGEHEIHKAFKQLLEGHCYWRRVHIGEPVNEAIVHLSDKQLQIYRGLIAKGG